MPSSHEKRAQVGAVALNGLPRAQAVAGNRPYLIPFGSNARSSSGLDVAAVVTPLASRLTTAATISTRAEFVTWGA